MPDELNKPRKEKKLFNNIRGYKRFFLFTGVYIGIFLILVAVSAEYTSKPSFCPTCHYMETFYQSWRISSHSKVECVECHFEPGISGTVRGKLNGLVQIVNYVSLTYKKRKPWAEISDNTCARSGCHVVNEFRDSLYDFKGVMFSHKNHLDDLGDGKKLKCTSCHSQIEQGTHIEVAASTCYSCHFKNSAASQNVFNKISQCATCHNWENKSKEQLASYRFDHTFVVANKLACMDCHTNTVSGAGNVVKERCYQCHFEKEKLEKITDPALLHQNHINRQGVKCFSCHEPIEHKIQKVNANTSPDCQSCHSNSHSSQVSLYTGENGFNVEKIKSPMFLNGINCKGCHIFHEIDKKDITTSKSSGSACEKCHGKGFDRLVNQWKQGTSKSLQSINSIYNTANSIISKSQHTRKPEAQGLLQQALHNIKIVEIGKSVHNIQFADKLLQGSYGLMKNALSIVNSDASLPVFITSADVIPNECYSCHSGIQEISKPKFGMNFSHNLHIVKEKVACNRCHSNEQKHGALIVNKTTCNNCHHAEGKTSEKCVQCHKFQEQVYNGNYLNKNQPDFMKVGGAGCNDCHVVSDKVVKPEKIICLKCHEAGYDDMMPEWKADVQKISAELQDMIKQVKPSNLNNEEKAEFEEAKKILNQLNSYPSIYVHNYDLVSTVLNEKKKKIKNLIK